MRIRPFSPFVFPPLLFCLFVSAAGAATFTVTNRNNSGAGSLRQAILEANSVLPPEAVLIRFNIALGMFEFPVISPTSPLPTILRTVVIDGTTQPSHSRVAVQGNDSTAGDGLHFGPASDGSLVRGLVISNWGDDGIELEQSSFTFVRGCWIGVDFFAGFLDQGNMHAGVHINNAFGVRVGGNTAADRNVISGNNANGVWIVNDSPGTIVTGNYIGISADGTTAIPNTNTGVLIVASSNNLVGGPTAAERNIISGNGAGVAILTANSVGNRIQGNYIGTDPTGVADLGNLVNGIRVNLAQNTLIGGDASQFGLAPGNVISGNGMAGVLIQSTSATTIQGNIIGGNFDGSADIPNGDDGIKVEDDPMSPGFVPRRTVIGGRGGLGNSISGNGDSGVWIRDGTGVVIQGNNVLRNFQHGLRIWTDRNLIGGPSADEGNIIADNQQNGILLQGAAGNLIGGATSGSGTFILGNGGHGILIMEGIVKGILTGGGHRIEGCNIGRNAHGGASPNFHFGVAIIDSANNIVGGTEEAKGNTIVANVDGGVEIQGELATGNRVLGNEIGTSALIVMKGGYANGHGVAIHKASNNFVGGTEPGSGNVISGNLVDGILLQGGSSNNRIQGNLIGLAADGIFGIGNGAAGI